MTDKKQQAEELCQQVTTNLAEWLDDLMAKCLEEVHQRESGLDPYEINARVSRVLNKKAKR